MATKMKTKCHSTSLVVTLAQFLQPIAIHIPAYKLLRGFLGGFFLFWFCLFVFFGFVLACLVSVVFGFVGVFLGCCIL